MWCSAGSTSVSARACAIADPLEIGPTELGLLAGMLRRVDFFAPLTIGQLEQILHEPRTASVVAAEPALLFTLIADDFKFVLKENPAAAEEMKRIGARRKFASDHKASS